MLWLSRIAAVGSGSRPSATRTMRRSLSWTASRTPSSVQRWYHLNTVDHGGRSCGSERHATPVLVRYRTAFRSSRGVCRGSCSGQNQTGGGISSSIRTHSASVTSLGYPRRSIPSALPMARLQPPMERDGQISCGTPSESAGPRARASAAPRARLRRDPRAREARFSTPQRRADRITLSWGGCPGGVGRR